MYADNPNPAIHVLIFNINMRTSNLGGMDLPTKL
jgi:hypothetical protein